MIRWACILIAALLSLALIAAAEQPCAISGRVVDERGAPVAHAAVSAMRGELAVTGVTAGTRGKFCLSGLPGGTFRLRATARTQPSSASPSCQACCAPATELKHTQPVAVTVEPTRPAANVLVSMLHQPAFCVRGEVRDQQGALMKTVFVGLETEAWRTGVLTEGGRFLLTSIPDGSYTLVVTDQPQLGRVLARQTFRMSGASITLRVAVPRASNPH